jgi:hypothetical protein
MTVEKLRELVQVMLGNMGCGCCQGDAGAGAQQKLQDWIDGGGEVEFATIHAREVDE